MDNPVRDNRRAPVYGPVGPLLKPDIFFDSIYPGLTMSDTHERRYDEDTQTMWVFYDFDDPKTLVPNDELRTWIKALKKGKTPDGDALDSVHYVLADEASASYNFQALAYANIDVFTGTLDDATPFEPEGGAPDFDTRSDFGIDD